MKVVLEDEPMARGGVGLDPSHNKVGRDTNQRSSHIVGNPTVLVTRARGELLDMTWQRLMTKSSAQTFLIH